MNVKGIGEKSFLKLESYISDGRLDSPQERRMLLRFCRKSVSSADFPASAGLSETRIAV
jgi:hypothetical protein